MANYYVIVDGLVNPQGRGEQPQVHALDTAQMCVDLVASLLRKGARSENIVVAKAITDATYAVCVDIQIPSEGIDLQDPWVVELPERL